MPLNERLRVFPDLVALAATRQQSQTDLDRLKSEEQALLDDADYRRLQDEVARCRAERERIKGQADQAAKDLREREHTEQAQRLTLDQKDAEAHAVAERRKAHPADPRLRCPTGRRAPGGAAVPGAVRRGGPLDLAGAG